MATTSTERRADAEEERSFVEPRNERVPVFVSVVLLVVLGVIAADIVIMDGWGDAIPMFVLFAIVLTMLLAVGPFEQQSAGIRRHVAAGSWLLPPIGFVAVILVLGEQDDQDDFFGAAAEVLPVLALALAIEATALHEQLKTDPIGRVIALSTFALIAYGEFEALEGLADGETTGRDAEIVWGALAAGALGIVLVAFRPRSKTDTSGGNDGTKP